MKPKNNIWFPSKRFGWGWGLPIAWQGWIVLAAYVVLLLGGSFVIPPETNPLGFIAYTAFISGILIAICYLKGDKPQWRWGDKS